MAEGSSQNGGTQTAVNGKCPDGYIHVFGPLCVEQTTLSKFEEALPDLPEIKITNKVCESVLASLNSVLKSVEQALEMPRKLKRMAEELIEKPFDAAEDMVNNTLGVLDDIGAMIDDFLSGPGAFINELKEALEGILACPYIADTPIGKTAATILDAIENGLPYTQMLSSLKSQLSSAAKGYIDRVEDIPLSKLSDMETLYNEMLERSGVNDLLKQAKELEKCLRAVCNLAELGARVPDEVEKIVESLGAKWDEASGQFTATLVKPVTANAIRAKQLADELAIIKLAGGG